MTAEEGSLQEVKAYRARCRCGYDLPTLRETMCLARFEAKLAGWEHIDGEWICAECIAVANERGEK